MLNTWSPIAGSVLLSALAASSPVALYSGTALLGLGMASIFATGFLWVEQRITITSKVPRHSHCNSGFHAWRIYLGSLLLRPLNKLSPLTADLWTCVLTFKTNAWSVIRDP